MGVAVQGQGYKAFELKRPTISLPDSSCFDTKLTQDRRFEPSKRTELTTLDTTASVALAKLANKASLSSSR